MTRAAVELVPGIGAAEVLALEGIGPDAEELTWFSGSLREGHGNAGSDIDLFVLGERLPQGPYTGSGGTNHLSAHYLRGQRIDFEFWTPAAVESLRERLAAARLGVTRDLIRTRFSYFEEVFLHRLRVGLQLTGTQRLAALKSGFNWRKLARYQAQETIRQLDTVLEDVAGMLGSGRVDCALFSAREAAGLAVDAYCHARGNTDPVRKWRAVHLARLDPAEAEVAQLLRGHWRAQFPDSRGWPGRVAAQRRYVEDCVAFAQQVVGWIQR